MHCAMIGRPRPGEQLRWTGLVVVLAALGGLIAGCERQSPAAESRVRIDGSSTVAPIMMAAAELFHDEAPGVKVLVGISGTGGGFKKFLEARPDLRTDINDASRPIRPSELKLAEQRGVEFIELPIGYDGIAVVVNPANDFCDALTVEELSRIWEPGSTIENWQQVRDGFPDVKLKLYGPGTDSGTFDYFTEAIMGKSGACRSDYTASENDNVLVQGVAGDRGALGYFGFAYFEANAEKLKLLGVAQNHGEPVQPSVESIRRGTYAPLSRPLLVYVNKQAYDEDIAVRRFLGFVLERAPEIVQNPRVGYVALEAPLYAAARERLKNRVLGTAFGEDHSRGLEELYLAPAQRAAPAEATGAP